LWSLREFSGQLVGNHPNGGKLPATMRHQQLGSTLGGIDEGAETAAMYLDLVACLAPLNLA
jgi:hypothetical protein